MKKMLEIDPELAVDFKGDQEPESILIHSLKYAYPKHSSADGILLSIEVDPFLKLCRSGQYTTMESLIKKYGIGSIHIEYAEDLPPRIKTWVMRFNI
jgi:hypothetical protein